MREVVKTIRGRRYRYRVERVRDETTGKMRSAWTYLGPAVDDGDAPPVRPRDASVKPRLLDALMRLLENAERDGLPTAGTIAKEAGLGHGTFYRHFKNKEAALDELITRLRGEFDQALPTLDEDAEPTLAEARRSLAAWVRASIVQSRRQPGMVRAFLRRVLSEPERRRVREERRAVTVERIEHYLRALHRRGLANLADPRATAAAIMLMIESAYWSVQRLLVIDEILERGIVDAVDRAVFGAPPPELDLSS